MARSSNVVFTVNEGLPPAMDELGGVDGAQPDTTSKPLAAAKPVTPLKELLPLVTSTTPASLPV